MWIMQLAFKNQAWASSEVEKKYNKFLLNVNYIFLQRNSWKSQMECALFNEQSVFSTKDTISSALKMFLLDSGQK